MNDIEYKTDLTEYKRVDVISESDCIYEYEAINPQNTQSRKNHNNFYLKISKWNLYQHLGEYIGYKIAQKIGFKCCDIKLYKAPRKRKPEIIEVGAISFVEKTKDDVIYLPQFMIDEYRKKSGMAIKKNWVYSVDTVLNAVFKKMSDDGRPYEDFLEFKQDFINMMIFDIKFTNSDRSSENWLLRTNKVTKKTDLYPMFDNAAILGFEVDSPNTDDLNQYAEKIKINDMNHPLTIVTPNSEMMGEDTEDYSDMLRYLLYKYPEHTKKALDAVNSYTVEDLIDELNKFDDMDEERKKFTISVFMQRDGQVNSILREWREKNIARS